MNNHFAVCSRHSIIACSSHIDHYIVAHVNSFEVILLYYPRPAQS